MMVLASEAAEVTATGTPVPAQVIRSADPNELFGSTCLKEAASAGWGRDGGYPWALSPNPADKGYNT